MLQYWYDRNSTVKYLFKNLMHTKTRTASNPIITENIELNHQNLEH